MKKVYKLVQVRYGRYLSFNIGLDVSKPNGRGILEYSTDILTKPTFGKLYAFDTYENALAYVKSFRPSLDVIEVWEALAGRVYKEKPSICTGGSIQYENFWKKDSFVYFSVAPEGTILCSSIKLLKRIEES